MNALKKVFFFLNRLNFLERFEGHSKAEWTVQSCPLASPPSASHPGVTDEPASHGITRGRSLDQGSLCHVCPLFRHIRFWFVFCLDRYRLGIGTCTFLLNPSNGVANILKIHSILPTQAASPKNRTPSYCMDDSIVTAFRKGIVMQQHRLTSSSFSEASDKDFVSSGRGRQLTDYHLLARLR